MGVKGLDQLEQIDAILGKEIIESSEAAIIEVANKIIELLQLNAPDNSGYLQQSIGLVQPIRKEEGRYVLEIEWEEYGTYQDEGVRGVGGVRKSGVKKGEPWEVKAPNSRFSYTNKMPPTNVSTIGGQSLRQYADSIGISPFAVAKSIFHEGLRATGWATNTIESQQAQSIIDDLATLIAKEFDK